jgi:hypothetical protein
MQAWPINKVSIALLCVLAVAGCSKTDAAPESSAPAPATSQSVDSGAVTNLIEAQAESAYRTALEASNSAAETLGLTELWYDASVELVQVLVQDPQSKRFVFLDVLEDANYPVDKNSMMPARLLAELDGLIAGGLDQGSVITGSQGEFIIINTIDLIKYVTTYTLDADGRIATASIIADEELLGTVTYNFSITPEGMQALAAG